MWSDRWAHCKCCCVLSYLCLSFHSSSAFSLAACVLSVLVCSLSAADQPAADLPEGENLHWRECGQGQKSRESLSLSDGFGGRHHHKVIVQLQLRQRLEQPDAADALHGRMPREIAHRPLLVGADGAALSRVLWAAVPAVCGLNHVVELHRSALGLLRHPLPARPHGGRAKPAGQRLELGHAYPQLSF